MTAETSLAAWSPRVLSILRIVTGLVFTVHGTIKVLGFPAGAAPGQQGLLTLFGIGGLLELFGGLLIVIGLFTRPVAFVLSGMMAVAYFMFHAPSSFYPAVNSGDAAILYCFVFLYLVFAGAGMWSVDALRSKRA